MKNPRIYGHPPYRTAAAHGGPGAAGEMAPVARELSKHRGVLEPLQTAGSLEGQIEELRTLLHEGANPPVTLIGFSWGAWLVLLLASRHPELVERLILVGCGPLSQQPAEDIEKTRMSRLSDEEREEIAGLVEVMNDPAGTGKDSAFARFGALYGKADAFDPLDLGNEGVDCRLDIFRGVWPEAARLRRDGGLLDCARRIRCPVLAVHGDHDPHPARGVREPLSAVLEDFRFLLLEKCGHRPWIERHARDRFYRILDDETK